MASVQTSVANHHSISRPGTEALGAEITELCAYIYAATYRLLVLIREFDEQDGWHQAGLCSCAHWLNFKCGIGMNAAREKVRVAHALKALPKISAAFERGELSYSKVRAMTRIADVSNEDYLLMIARHGSAYQMEKLVQKFRRSKRLEDAELANEQHRDRSLSYFYDDDGCLVIKARLPAEQGALIVKALEMAMDSQCAGAASAANDAAIDTANDVYPKGTWSAETSEEPIPIAAGRADALADIAETYMNNSESSGSTADRYQVVVHVRQNETSASTESSHLEDGPHVSAETSRRIACDCISLGIKEDENGEPFSIGRRSRTIPPPMRRALRIRDEGCRFSGCTNTRFIDGHHIQHWADGGETSLDNLVQLCRHHHHLVHEGGYGCERTASGEIVFSAPDRRVLPAYALLPAIDRDPKKWFDEEMRHLDLDAETCVPHWYAGETMDWDMAVSALFAPRAPGPSPSCG